MAMEKLDEMEEVGSDYHVRERRTLPRATAACYIERGATSRIAYRGEITLLGSLT